MLLTKREKNRIFFGCDPFSSRESSRSGKPVVRDGLVQVGDLCKLTRISDTENLFVVVPLLFLMRYYFLKNEEAIPNLVNSLQANDWKERQQAVDQFVDLVQLNPDGLGPKFTKV